MSELKYILGPMRLPFLVLAPACVLAGWGSAAWEVGGISVLYLILAFAGGIAAHVSVNALNEYFDFKSGLDLRTRPTPFSGGSGTLPQNPEKVNYALIVGLVAAGIVALIGVYFISVWGIMILPLGVLGLFVIIAYTPWLNHNVFLCLIAPGLGFGTLMVMGVDFVLSGAYSWTSFFASLPSFFLVSNLLLLNQFPDLEADRSIGRKNLPIVSGRPFSAIIYTIFLALTYLSIVIGVLLGYLPAFTLLGLLTIIPAVPVVMNVLKNADQVEALIPSMGLNVLINILTPVLVAIGFFIS
ncbi:MAG: prenyltransferase [Anaerolineaceae bacterium]|nr:prenyltransferase [Anaerolineaceae bacterium]